MGLLDMLKKSAPAATAAPVTDQRDLFKLGSTQQDVIEHFKGHKIEPVKKLSEDFTIDDEVRDIFKRREAIYPHQYMITPVRLYNHRGFLNAEFSEDNLLGSWKWVYAGFESGKGDYVDTPVTMEIVNQIVSEMESKLGKTKKETDGNDFTWQWEAESVRYILYVTWIGEGDEDNFLSLQEEYILDSE